MKTYLTSIGAILFCVTFCRGQTSGKPKLNAASLELGKTGLIYNLYFDHRLATRNVGFRLGAGSNLGKYINLISVGGGGYHLMGKTKNFFELGLDFQYQVVDEISDDQRVAADIFIFPNYPVKTLCPSLNVGYRLYGERTLFRVGFSPGVIKSKLIPGGYISYGFTF